MNLPNKLTILRVILIPFFVVFMDRDICCIAVFCGWTDDRNDVLAVKES